jgi:hypothetical protein
MNSEKQHPVKDRLKKVGGAVLDALPWIFMWIGLTSLLLIPLSYADEYDEMEAKVATLEAENARYEAENNRLEDEADWLRLLVEKGYFEGLEDGQTQ